MSVEERSCFSYQVAAGSTMSDSRVVEVLRKSAVNSRSSLPTGASSRHTISRGRDSSPTSFACTALSVPRRCRMKNSAPLAELPNRLVRHEARIRGKFSGASGSSAANRRRPAFSSSTTYSAGALPASAASAPSSSGLRSNVG